MSEILCPRCKKEPAIIHASFGVTHGAKCKAKDYQIREHPEFGTLSMQDRITKQRDKDLGGIAQPFNEDGSPNETFVKANSREDVEQFFTKEELAANGY